MRLFGRRPGAPDQVLGRAGLAPREAVLASGEAADGTWLLGTRDALLVVPPAGEEVARIPWQQVESADWNRDDGRLRVVEVAAFGSPRPRREFTVDDPADLLQLVRERVTASVLMQRRVTLAGNRGFFVIARRPPGGGGAVSWAFRFDPGVDPDEPGVRAAADQALAMAEDELGDLGRSI